MNDISRVLKVMKERKNENFAIATVIRVEGSAYRHEGAKMLIDKNGKTFGIISAGCLEEDVVHQGLEVIQSNKSKRLTYNLKAEDDLDWGHRPGCDGIIHVYIEQMGWNTFIAICGQLSVLSKVHQKMHEGLRVVSVKRMEPEVGKEEKLYYCEDGEILYHSMDFSLVEQIIPYCKKSIMQEIPVQLTSVENVGEILIELYKPLDTLYILGAGPDVEPLVKYASTLDFSIRIVKLKI